MKTYRKRSMRVDALVFFHIGIHTSAPVVAANTHAHSHGNIRRLIKEKQEFTGWYVMGYRVWPSFPFACRVQRSTERRNGSQQEKITPNIPSKFMPGSIPALLFCKSPTLSQSLLHSFEQTLVFIETKQSRQIIILVVVVLVVLN